MSTNKPAITAAELRERVEMARAIDEMRGLSEEAQNTIEFTAEELSVIMGKSVKTLQRARTERKQAKKAKRRVPGNSLASLASVKPQKNEMAARYTAASLTAYWGRRVKAAKAESEALGVPTSTLRGFQSWLVEGTPAETWPFSIQPDGRPMDMAEAIRARMLTGKAARLNIREFATQLTYAASESFSGVEADAIASVSRHPKDET